MKNILLSLSLLSLSACGEDAKTSTSCENQALSNKSVTVQTSAGPVTTLLHSDCSYQTEACHEVGTWQMSGANQITFHPTQTTCGNLNAAVCDYSLVNSLILFSCH